MTLAEQEILEPPTLWQRIEAALRRAAWVFVQGTRWLVGFLWMADAGGRGAP